MTKAKADALLALVKEWIALGDKGAVTAPALVMILWTLLDTEREEDVKAEVAASREVDEMLFKAGYFDGF